MKTRMMMVGVLVLVAVLSPVALAGARSVPGGTSGDDAYDPAAGGLPALSSKVASARALADRVPSGINSGDDAYDPAAGGLPALMGKVASPWALVDALPSGGYSGDDAYDPAAGGMPQLPFLVAFGYDWA